MIFPDRRNSARPFPHVVHDDERGVGRRGVIGGQTAAMDFENGDGGLLLGVLHPVDLVDRLLVDETGYPKARLGEAEYDAGPVKLEV